MFAGEQIDFSRVDVRDLKISIDCTLVVVFFSDWIWFRFIGIAAIDVMKDFAGRSLCH